METALPEAELCDIIVSSRTFNVLDRTYQLLKV